MFKQLVSYYLVWRIGVFIVLLFSLTFIPLGSSDKYLGGGVINYHRLPEIFAHANFDGEHYLSIAAFGYHDREHAFFPLYPLITSLLATPFKEDLFSSYLFIVLIGVILSSICFFVALVLLVKLIRLDFNQNISRWTVILILLFPTSFYFGLYYSESLFFLLLVTSFYLARTNRWTMAGIFGMLAASSRVFGILILPSLLIEAYQQKVPLKKILPLLIIPLGLVSYMYYQWQTIGNPLEFYQLQGTIGEHRTLGITFYPQVIFRYIKMIITVSPSNSIYQTILLEFFTGVVFLVLPIIGYFKNIRWSYLFLSLIGLMLSPLQGSLSSVPRYVIVLFPSFIVLAMLIEKLPKINKIIITTFLAILLLVEASLFFRGFWIG